MSSVAPVSDSIDQLSKSEKQNGIPVLPNVGISYRNLSYSIMLTKAESSHEVDNVCTKYMELITLPIRLPYMIAKGVATRQFGPPKTELKVLDRVDGRIRPGTMTLLLSPPGHGKSSLLKALAQLLPPNELKGEILYGNEQPSGLIEKSIYPGHLVQYVEQLDQHLPYLTVRETLEFIHQNSLADPAEFGYVDMAQAHKDRVKDTLTMLQLNNCADTLIGNELLRGISGGEKKRVTVGEGLLTNARVLLMDEISTGLDAAVTFDICHSLRQRVTSTHLSAVIALLQPTPEVYALFDEVILMREGQVMYHGPRVELPAYLRQLGFEVPEDVRDEKSESKDADMADFLSELVFTPFKALPKVDDVLKPVPPLDTEGLVYAWKHSALYEAQMNSQPDSPIVLETAFQEAQYGKEYVHDPMHHSKLLLLRQLTLMTRNKLSVVFRLMSSLLLSVLYGGLYYQKTIAEGLPRYGLFMNCLMYLAMGNMSEMPPAVDFKYVAYKHTANNAHPKFAYVLAAQAAHLCVSIVNVILYTSVIYWMAGLTPYASNFFIFMLCGFLSDQMMGALSRAAAYAAATTQAASTFLLPFISLMIIFMGYLLPRGHMGWTIIFFYINPFAWLFRALAINEFVSPPFEIRPGGPNTATLGTLYLNTFDIENDSQWIWWGILHACVAVVLAIWLAFRMFATVRHDRNIGSARRLIPIDEDVLKELEVRKSNRGVVENPKAEPENQLSNINAGAAAPIEMAAMSKITQSVLHFQPMSIVFQDMKYTVELPENKGSKVLLQGISGYASPGRMLALMGASGAGKTTLLDVLSSRKNSGKMEGRILLNGFEKEEDSFSRITSYVEQQDIHMPEPTVREALQFSAALRLPPEVTVVQREAFIEEVLDLLELRPIQNRAIGDAGAADGLAPGERKRLTIAVELVSNAPVIFADEPTSGLDARSAQVVVRTLRNVAATGRTVICTIHQPSAELFFMFDDLLLLQKGGFMAYFGPMGERACQLVEYLQKLEGAKPCPSDFNPASWMLDQLAGTDSSIGADEQKHQQAAQPAPVESEKQPAADGSQNAAAASAAPAPVMGIPGEYLQSTLFASALWAEQSAQLQKLSQPLPGSQPVRFAGKQARTWLEQYLLLCERVQTAYIRNLGFNYGRVVSLLVLFLLFGTVYANLQVTDLSGVTSLVCVIFMTCQFAVMINMQSIIPFLVKRRAAFYREQSSYMYDSHAYAMAHFTVEVPWIAAILLGLVWIVYFMIPLSSDPGTFFFHLVCCFGLSVVFVSVGTLLAVSMPSMETAQLVASPLSSICMLFGGLFAPTDSIAVGLRWLTYIDPINYGFRALLPVHFYCTGAPYSLPNSNQVLQQGCPTIQVPTLAAGLVTMDRWAYTEKTYSFDYGNRYNNFGILFIFVVVFQMMVFYNNKHKRFIVR